MGHLLHTEYGGITNVLRAEILLGPAFIIGKGAPPPLVAFNAIWDTGASGTVITQNVVQALGLKPISVTLSYHAQGQSMANVYSVCVRFPNGPGFAALRVSEGKLQGFDVLIGMDVISAGDFQITNVNGKTRLAFHLPSMGGDALQSNIGKMLKEQAAAESLAKIKATPPKPFSGTARNTPCPCGSGLKYKLCCGK